ncbi:hypothetical protein ES707_08529 [subsurface metagenome]
MSNRTKLSRREFIKGITGAAAGACIGGTLETGKASAGKRKSKILRIDKCPVHDSKLRHIGLDSMLSLMSGNELKFYRTGKSHPWGGPDGIIEPHDVVLIKVNSQWKFRGTTNTDVVRGVIHRILEHPDGFSGEVVIFENGQMQGSFDGDPLAWGRYKKEPECAGVHVNAEDDTLTVDRLVNEVFAGASVSSFLLDPVCSNFIANDDHTASGYRKITDAMISYPCFTTTGKHRVELREGIWNGKGYDNNLKLINIPVLKTHPGTGITCALKNSYGILSMKDDDNWRKIRHYEESGSQCGKMYSLVRMPDLNIIDAVWVTHQTHHRGYPPSTTHRADILLAGTDPVALDYYGSKHILLPLGGDRAEEHDPDSFPGLINHLTGAQKFLNKNGGIKGKQSQQGDDNIKVISRRAET